MYRLFLLFFFLVPQFLFSQVTRDSAQTIPMFSATYSYQVPGGDLAKRFGNNSTIGGSFSVKTKSNFIIGIEGHFLFGDSVKESGIFDSIRISNGQILNKYGEYAKVIISERGYHFAVRVGKLFPVFGSNPNSGILTSVSVGFMEHKIRIENDGNNAPQILEDYKKGYDRLSNGLAFSSFVGYMYMGKRRFINFTIGLEFFYARTKCRREYNFDTMEKDTRARNDFLSAAKVSWMIPINKRMPEKYYYY